MMVRGRRRRGRRRRVRRRRKKRSKLADKKINTLIEKRIVQISKTARSDTHQDFVLGTYHTTGEINQYYTVNPTPNPALIATSLNTTPVYNPETMGGDDMGKRKGDVVWIKGWKITGMLSVPGSNNIPAQRLAVAIVSAKRPPNATYNAPPIANDYGPNFCYNELNGRLKTPEEIEQYKHTRIEHKRVFNLRSYGKNEINLPFTINHFFKKPRMQRFMTQDQTGLYPLNRSYYLVFYTDKNQTAEAPISMIVSVRKYFFTE